MAGYQKIRLSPGIQIQHLCFWKKYPNEVEQKTRDTPAWKYLGSRYEIGIPVERQAGVRVHFVLSGVKT